MNSTDSIAVQVVDPVAYLSSPHFVASVDVQRGSINWQMERRPVKFNFGTREAPRYISATNSAVWVDINTRVMAEISSTANGELLVSGRSVKSGMPLWERVVPIPDAAPWAETSPAWRGAQTEEIYGFIADNPRYLVVCLFRQSRKSMHSSPAEGIEVMSLPPYNCETDCMRFDPDNGSVVWRKSFEDVYVGVLERAAFSGLWSNGAKIGFLDFELGTNSVLHKSLGTLGYPVRAGTDIAVSWHGKGKVGVDWLDERGGVVRSWDTRQPGIRSTRLHATGAGLALQTNDQSIWWFGEADAPLWNARAKPYIYRVFRALGTDVFVGTDGGGGRLFAYDTMTGDERLNLKPKYGGAGDSMQVLGHDRLIAKFWTTGKTRNSCELVEISMRDRTHEVLFRCSELIGIWQHGAICRTGTNGERLAIVDIRDSGNQ